MATDMNRLVSFGCPKGHFRVGMVLGRADCSNKLRVDSLDDFPKLLGLSVKLPLAFDYLCAESPHQQISLLDFSNLCLAEIDEVDFIPHPAKFPYRRLDAMAVNVRLELKGERYDDERPTSSHTTLQQFVDNLHRPIVVAVMSPFLGRANSQAHGFAIEKVDVPRHFLKVVGYQPLQCRRLTRICCAREYEDFPWQ